MSFTIPIVYRVLGIDPGRGKCGLAVIESGCEAPLARAIVPRADIVAAVSRMIAEFTPQAVALGAGTEGRVIQAELGDLTIPVTSINEYGTTLAARERYFNANPPRGLMRLLPRGLLFPPEPIDDWAAVLIAERFLANV